MEEGWIKIHRKIWDNPIVRKDNTHFLVWIYLLLHATHKEYDVIFNNQRITLKQGQLIVGRRAISIELGVSESKIQRILKLFENEQQIEQQTTPQNRLISILNWDRYQHNEQPFEQQVNNNRTTSEQQVNTNKNIKNVRNNIKEEVKEEKIHFADFVTMTNAEYDKLVSTYGKNFADQCIEILDNYKGANGKKYKSDYRAILTWVVDKLKAQKSATKTNNMNNYPQREHKDLDRLYANSKN